jgi:hypothetical protein
MTIAPAVSRVASGRLTTRASQAASSATAAPINTSAHQPMTRLEFLLMWQCCASGPGSGWAEVLS